MFELTIKDVVYQFKFGIGFVREINKRVTKEIEGTTAKQELGLQYAIAGIIDEDAVALVDVLDLANKTEKPRVTRNQLEAYIEDEDTDIEEVFDTVIDFFGKANVTRPTYKELTEIEK